MANQNVPIVTQPAAGSQRNCPIGLDILANMDAILVEQCVEFFEVLTGYETNNKYSINNTLGQVIFWAAEDSNCCTRNCCGARRPFDMKILDLYKNEVMHIYRPLRCACCCCPCCLQKLEVSAPPGVAIGQVHQNWSLCYPYYSIKNTFGETILKIHGPLIRSTCSSCCEIEFKIKNQNGDNVGKITKRWSGYGREVLTDADKFAIALPMELDCKMKAVCLAALFLIDFMYFETTGKQD